MVQYSAALRAAMLASVNQVLGTGARFVIYSGPAPAFPEATGDQHTMLASLACSTTPFGTPTGTPGEDVAMLSNNLLADTDAAATDDATFFRVIDGSGVAHLQGTVGIDDDADLIFNSTAIQIHAAVSVTGPVLILPA